jgi:phosphatidyl-myo-inositol alpha-mannosyltransferase
MKVAMVCPYAWDLPGGVQSHIRSLAPALRHRGHEVEVFAPSSWHAGKRSNALGEAGRERPTLVGRTVGIPANGSVAPITFGPVAAYRIRESLAQFDPDVLHLHEPLIPSLSLLALLSARAPAVGTFHAAAASSPLYRIFRPVLTALAARLRLRTAVSDAAERLFTRYFPGELFPTPNGVDVASFAEATPARLGAGPNVLFLGRLEPRKGADVLIRAVALLNDNGGVRLLIAGEGRERSKLEALAADVGTDVQFLGAVSEQTKRGLLRACDVYCAPNLHGESFGIVLLEAMASGCPIVCSDLPEFEIVAGDAAVFGRRGDPVALANALRTVLSDPERARTMRQRSSDRALAFDWSRLVPEVESIYERALAAAS